MHGYHLMKRNSTVKENLRAFTREDPIRMI